MKLCPRCGCLSFFNAYFQKWMCNTCEHQFKEQDEGEFTEEEIDLIRKGREEALRGETVALRGLYEEEGRYR